MRLVTNPLTASTKQLFGEWARAISHTPSIFKRIAFRRRTLEEELQEALLRGSLRKAFAGFDLWMLGLGLVIGSGWAQLTGSAGQQYAGPAVIVSYLFAGLAALLSAVCFAELCTEFPVSGGAFSYIMVTFGELPAFVALASLLLEYALGMAAQARGFSTYLTSLLNLAPHTLIIEIGNNAHTLDPLAAGIVMLMSVLLSLGVRESAWFISGVTSVKIVLLLVVAGVGYAIGSVDNMTPFLNHKYDVDGLFLGASVVFFTSVGFDAIANAAEEVRNVAHLPWAIVGTVLASTLVYALLALALALIVYPGISCPSYVFFLNGDSTVNFIDAFVKGHGLKYMQYVVSLAALFGIVTALTVGLFSASRIVMAASRDWLLPPFLARISPRTQTPLVAQMVLGVIIALLAMFVEVDAATALVSFGTLIVLWLVCNAQMQRRYYPDVQMRFTRYGTVETTAGGSSKPPVSSWVPGRRLSVKMRKVLVWVHMLAINAASLGLAVYYSETSMLAGELSPLPGPTPPPPPPGSPNACATMLPPAPSSVVQSCQACSATATADQQQTCQPCQACVWATEAAPGCSPTATDLHHQVAVVAFVGAWFLVTLSFQLCCPLEYEPAGWHVPWWAMPWLPSAGLLLVVFSLGALPASEYWKVGAYLAALLLFYLLYSLPMSYIKHSQVDYSNTGELKVVELAFVDNRWQPARLGLVPTMTPMMSGRVTGLTSVHSALPGSLKVDSRHTSKSATSSGGSGPQGAAWERSAEGRQRSGDSPRQAPRQAPRQPPTLSPDAGRMWTASNGQLSPLRPARGGAALPTTQEGDEVAR